MSLKKFFQRIWDSIENFFQGLLPELKDAIAIGVTVVDNMKKVMENPVVDVLTAIIPGDLDDQIKNRLRALLPKILVDLRLASECSELSDPNEIVKCAIKTLQQIGGDFISDSAKKNFYDSIAVLVAQVAADGKLSWDDSKYVIKWYYDHKR